MTKHAAHRRRVLIAGAKLTLAAAIIGYLVYQLRGQALFTRLVAEPKQWEFLLLAQGFVLAALAVNIVRWYVLVRTLGLDFRLADAFRLGCLGFLLNQVSPGSVGGDLFKAAFIAREQPTRRTEAVATVLIDRVVGLYAMLLVASCGQALARGSAPPDAALETLSWIVALSAIVGTLALAAFLFVPVDLRYVRHLAGRVPLIGGTLARLVDASGAYRDRRLHLLGAVALAAVAHVLLVLAFWSIGQGLPVAGPNLSAMMLVGPLSMVAGAIPVTPSGLGTMEAAMNQLFVAVGSQEGDGFLVSLAYRVATYVAASVGGIYYFSARSKVQRALKEAEALADTLDHRP